MLPPLTGAKLDDGVSGPSFHVMVPCRRERTTKRPTPEAASCRDDEPVKKTIFERPPLPMGRTRRRRSVCRGPSLTAISFPRGEAPPFPVTPCRPDNLGASCAVGGAARRSSYPLAYQPTATARTHVPRCALVTPVTNDTLPAYAPCPDASTENLPLMKPE